MSAGAKVVVMKLSDIPTVHDVADFTGAGNYSAHSISRLYFSLLGLAGLSLPEVAKYVVFSCNNSPGVARHNNTKEVCQVKRTGAEKTTGEMLKNQITTFLGKLQTPEAAAERVGKTMFYIIATTAHKNGLMPSTFTLAVGLELLKRKTIPNLKIGGYSLTAVNIVALTLLTEGMKGQPTAMAVVKAASRIEGLDEAGFNKWSEGVYDQYMASRTASPAETLRMKVVYNPKLNELTDQEIASKVAMVSEKCGDAVAMISWDRSAPTTKFSLDGLS